MVSQVEADTLGGFDGSAKLKQSRIAGLAHADDFEGGCSRQGKLVAAGVASKGRHRGRGPFELEG